MDQVIAEYLDAIIQLLHWVVRTTEKKEPMTTLVRGSMTS